MIRKYAFIVVSTLISLSVFPKGADDIYKEFSKKEGVQSLNVGSLGLSIAKSCINFSDKELKDNIKDIKSVKILSFDECSKDDILSFKNKVSNLKTEGYELILKNNEDNEDVSIYVKIEKEKISEMVIVSISDSPSMVFIKGTIDPEKISKSK
ncbi:MAG: DUF4252 domain-containing protein [Bacteroidales bacterium]|nr:DUF4252 domain-containing protein [Bacteroidales bacterium]